MLFQIVKTASKVIAEDKMCLEGIIHLHIILLNFESYDNILGMTSNGDQFGDRQKEWLKCQKLLRKYYPWRSEADEPPDESELELLKRM